jgi:N-acetylglucosamine kinase-like BadF-type ATPase
MSKQVPKFYVGVDSGGTKCEILLVDTEKKPIIKKSFKAFHYSVFDADIVAARISEYIFQLLKLKELDLKDCEGICIGLAGAREARDRAKIRSSFAKELKFRKITVETDTMTGIYGAFEGEDGIILISGTGSVLYAMHDGVMSRIGGWGRIIGDPGSGYWIGQKGLQLIVDEYDLEERTQYTMLTNLADKKFNITKHNILDKVFHQDFEVQKLAPLVIECAEKKDQKCIGIINEAVEKLTKHIHLFFELTKRKKKIDLAFIGSIIENDNLLSQKLKARIEKDFKNVNVIIKKNSPVFGAVLLAEKFFVKTPSNNKN